MTTEIYKAWTPTYRDSKNASGAAAAGDSGGLRFQSGLQQLVVERVEETKMADLREREVDHKAAKKVENNSLHTACARTGELLFILTLVALIGIIVFLGAFFSTFNK